MAGTMIRSFRGWTGSRSKKKPDGPEEPNFGVWLPVYHMREKCPVVLTISFAATPKRKGVAELEFPLKVGVVVGSQPAFDAAEPKVSGDYEFMDEEKCRSRMVDAPKKILVSVGRSQGDRKLYDLAGGTKWVTIHDRESLNIFVQAVGPGSRTVAICVRHEGQREKALFGGSSLFDVRVTEELFLRGSGKAKEPRTLYDFPGITRAVIPLASAWASCTVQVEPAYPGAKTLELFEGGKVTEQANAFTTFDSNTKELTVECLPDDNPHSLRFGRVQLIRTGYDESFVPGPVLSWEKCGRLQPLLAFGDKTGWSRQWIARQAQAGEEWSLVANSIPYGKRERRGDEPVFGMPQFFITRGSGLWPVARVPDMRFASNSLIGFTHVFPDSAIEHDVRCSRWLRKWMRYFEDAQSDANQAPWFEAAFPFLGPSPTARALGGECEFFALPFLASLHRDWAETWVADRLHNVFRENIAGHRKWDGLMGTLRSQSANVFDSQYPTEVADSDSDGIVRHVPRFFGEQVDIVVPVASQSSYDTVLDLVNSVPRGDPSILYEKAVGEGVRRVSDSREDAATIDRHRERARAEMLEMPPGILVRQGRVPAGIVMVPSGFGIAVHQPATGVIRPGPTPNKDHTYPPVVESAFRTPRLLGVPLLTRLEHLAGRSTLLGFREVHEKDEVVARRPLRVGVAFVLSFGELYAMTEGVGRKARELLGALRWRFRVLTSDAWLRSLLFSREPAGSMGEFLYTEWRMNQPGASDEMPPMSYLLVAAILNVGRLAAEVKLDAAMRNKWYSVRGELHHSGILHQNENENNEIGYSRVRFVDNPANGAWQTRLGNEEQMQFRTDSITPEPPQT